MLHVAYLEYSNAYVINEHYFKMRIDRISLYSFNVILGTVDENLRGGGGE